ncbi:MAG: hypothetical protein GXP25_09440 [Planctomycetes bacterium]|nr:hypothetical protein [Planctomycetota bacterium]
MACGTEHWFVLDFAMRHTSWRPDRFKYGGYQRKTMDVFNHLAIYPDIVADWLWQKPPWVRSAIDAVLSTARASKNTGDELGAVGKLALASHYVADSLAVSHTWLDFIADQDQFESPEVIHKRFHDPVENQVADFIEKANPEPAPKGVPFRTVYDEAWTKAYEIGRQIFQRFFRDESVEDLLIAGVENSAQAVHAMFESVEHEFLLLSHPTKVTRAREKWVMRHLLDMTGNEITSLPFKKDFVAKMKNEVGYEGGAIFFDLPSCAPHAQEEGKRWHQERIRWREVTMAFILPPRRQQPITADWRPPEAELIG